MFHMKVFMHILYPFICLFMVPAFMLFFFLLFQDPLSNQSMHLLLAKKWMEVVVVMGPLQ